MRKTEKQNKNGNKTFLFKENQNTDTGEIILDDFARIELAISKNANQKGEPGKRSFYSRSSGSFLNEKMLPTRY